MDVPVPRDDAVAQWVELLLAAAPRFDHWSRGPVLPLLSYCPTHCNLCWLVWMFWVSFWTSWGFHWNFFGLLIGKSVIFTCPHSRVPHLPHPGRCGTVGSQGPDVFCRRSELLPRILHPIRSRCRAGFPPRRSDPQSPEMCPAASSPAEPDWHSRESSIASELSLPPCELANPFTVLGCWRSEWRVRGEIAYRTPVPTGTYSRINQHRKARCNWVT